jgi:hypothetical protein
MTRTQPRPLSVFAARLAIACLVWPLAAGVAQAAVRSADYLVDAKTMPWKSNAQSDDYLPYGIYDGRFPGVLGRFNGFSLEEGAEVSFRHTSGKTSAFSNREPYSGPLGDLDYVTDDNKGSTGKVFPSAHVDKTAYPLHLMALLGLWADDNLDPVGKPFLIGRVWAGTVPKGADYLLFGFNDDLFDDNRGALVMTITADRIPLPPGGAGGPFVSTVVEVPEPETWVQMACGATILMLALQRGRRKRSS